MPTHQDKIGKGRSEALKASLSAVALMIVVFVGLGWFVLSNAEMFGFSAISATGWIALAVGFAGTVIIGGGLMALLFFSARSGHDEKVGPETGPTDAGDR